MMRAESEQPPLGDQSAPRFRIAWALIWAALLLLAFGFDRTTAQWVLNHHPINKSARWVFDVKLMGNYWFTLIIALFLVASSRHRLYAAIALLLSGALGGLLYLLIKWIAGRYRPVIRIDPFGFSPFPGGLGGLFQEKGLGFPSGHACLAFASAMTLTLALPKWNWLWFLLAAIVGAERVLENAHYLSDVVAGAGIGALCGWVVWNLVQARRRLGAER